MTDDLFNVRMRASEGDRHISGAETITEERLVEETAKRLVSRALDHPRGDPDDVVVTVGRLSEDPIEVPALPVVTVETADVASGRDAAGQILQSAGIDERVVERAFDVLQHDTAERGAALLDVGDGVRHDPDPERGVRVSRLGTSERSERELKTALDDYNLASTRIQEALVLATKVAHAPGVVAELCWSDNPEYTAGYVATDRGYRRFPTLKSEGDPQGGRVFFLDSDADIETTIRFLERRPVVVDKVQSFDRVAPETVSSSTR